MNKQIRDRYRRLMIKGIPRYVRCYDDGADGTFDRFTIVYTGRHSQRLQTNPYNNNYPYVSMSEFPIGPQGFCQHNESTDRPIDVDDHWWPPKIGQKNHLGTRVEFTTLPTSVRIVVKSEYRDLWDLPNPKTILYYNYSKEWYRVVIVNRDREVLNERKIINMSLGKARSFAIEQNKSRFEEFRMWKMVRDTKLTEDWKYERQKPTGPNP